MAGESAAATYHTESTPLLAAYGLLRFTGTAEVADDFATDPAGFPTCPGRAMIFADLALSASRVGGRQYMAYYFESHPLYRAASHQLIECIERPRFFSVIPLSGTDRAAEGPPERDGTGIIWCCLRAVRIMAGGHPGRLIGERGPVVEGFHEPTRRVRAEPRLLRRLSAPGAAIAVRKHRPGCHEPPYWGQRTSAGVGVEDDPRTYVAALTERLAELKRALKPEGLLWVNIGDA